MMTMTFSDALLYSLLGVSVVFFALVLLIIAINLMNIFDQDSKAKQSPSTPSTAAEDMQSRKRARLVGISRPISVTEPAPVPVSSVDQTLPDATVRKFAPGSAGELKLYDTDVRDAAMIMAIVADTMGVPLNELRFKSIRELK